MIGCNKCNTQLTLLIAKRRVCYYCGGDLVEIVIDDKPTDKDLYRMDDDYGGEIAGDPIYLIDNDDGAGYD